MKRILFTIGLCLCTLGVAVGQVNITDASTITIDFTTTVSGVNNGAFDGSGFATSPSAGQLDAGAWAATGFSDGDKAFGVVNTSGDYARGTSTGGVSSGGLYSFDVGSSDPAIGFQGTGGDFTPGTIILKITNNSGSIITDLDVSYEAWVYNDQDRSNSLNFSHSSDNSSYTSEASLDLSSTATADVSPAWVKTDKSISLSGLSIADGGDYYIRWSSDDVSGSGSRDEFAIDDIALSPTLEAAGAPAKLAVTEINGGSSPSTGTAFDVVVQLQDDDDNPVSATQDTSVTLSVGAGTGSIGGTITGTISDGENTVTISGVTYDTAESGVQLTATNTGGSLTAGTSSAFEVLAAADQLVLVGVDTEGTTDIDIDDFTVEARRSGDSSVDLNYTKSITVSIASGTGNLDGTTSQSASSGVATFSGLSFDAEDDFTIEATDGSLTSAASATIAITDPEPSALIISGVYDGAVNSQPKGIEIFVTEDIADLSSYGVGSANNGGGTDGEEFTFPADAASAGDFIYIAATSTGFNTFFGFDADYTDGALNINGDDAIELFKDGVVTDVFGDINVDGSGQAWEHTDGWAYRKNIEEATTTFDVNDWTFSGTGELDNAVNSMSSTPFPTGTYTNGWFVHLHGSEGWRMLATPTSNNSYDDLLGDIWTQGIGTGADATSGTANVQLYNTTTDNFAAVTDLTATMTTGTGFITFVYSDDDYTNSGADAGFPKTLSLSGTENSGDVSPTLNTEGDAFTLVGNPYASTIDWDLISRTDVTGTVYVYDNADSGYDTWNGTTGDLTDGLIATYQGFWVQNTSGSPTPSLTIQEADKSSGGTFRKDVNPSTIKLTAEMEELSANAHFSFTSTGELGKDNFDGLRLDPLDFKEFLSISTVVGDEQLSINNLPSDLNEEVTIPMDVEAFTTAEEGWIPKGGEITLTWPELKNLPEHWEITLTDYKTGITTNIRTESSYTFIAEEAKGKVKPKTMYSMLSPVSVVKSKSTNESSRFGITLTPSTSVSIDDEIDAPTEFTLGQNYPNPFNPTTNINYSVGKAGPVNITVYNVMGQKVAELLNTTKSAGSYQITWNATGVASGIYYYRLTAPGQVLTRQMTLIK